MPFTQQAAQTNPVADTWYLVRSTALFANNASNYVRILYVQAEATLNVTISNLNNNPVFLDLGIKRVGIDSDIRVVATIGERVSGTYCTSLTYWLQYAENMSANGPRGQNVTVEFYLRWRLPGNGTATSICLGSGEVRGQRIAVRRHG